MITELSSEVIIWNTKWNRSKKKYEKLLSNVTSVTDVLMVQNNIRATFDDKSPENKDIQFSKMCISIGIFTLYL